MSIVIINIPIIRFASIWRFQQNVIGSIYSKMYVTYNPITMIAVTLSARYDDTLLAIDINQSEGLSYRTWKQDGSQ